MSLLKNLKLRPIRFASDEAGNMPAEGVIASVFLVWWYVASFQFFDAYREKNINLKAAYTVADLISRQTNAIDANYVDGLNTLFDYLTHSSVPTWVRVTSVIWDEDEQRFEVQWSYATGEVERLNTATLQEKANRIPQMPAGDFVTIVETNMAYEPIFNIGLRAQWYTTFITTRPRYNACVPWRKSDGTTAGCNYDPNIDTGGNIHNDGEGFVDPEA